MVHKPFYTLFAALIFTSYQSATIDPTLFNTTHELYIVSKYMYNTTNSTFANHGIHCRTDCCHIVCDEEEGCYNITVNASISNRLIIECNHNDSCSLLSLTAFHSASVSIHCLAPRSCLGAIIDVKNTANLTITSKAEQSMKNATIYSDTMSNVLDITCDGYESCANADIHCPFSKEGACDIHCLQEDSCHDIGIFIKDSLEHQLNLICTDGTSCDGVIHCEYEANPETAYFVGNNCTNYKAACCPFTTRVIKCEVGSQCQVNCSTCAQHHIDASEAESLLLKCSNNEIGSGCKGAQIECPNGNGAYCNIECSDKGSCSQLFIKTHSGNKEDILNEFNIICTANSSCDEMMVLMDGNVNKMNSKCIDNASCDSVLIAHREGIINEVHIVCNGSRVCSNLQISLKGESIGSVHWQCMLYHNLSNPSYPATEAACHLAYLMIDEEMNTVNISCVTQQSCHQLDINVDGVVDNMNIVCGAEAACYNSFFNLRGIIGEINLICSADNSCTNYEGTYGTGYRYDDAVTFYSYASAIIQNANIVCIGSDACYHLSPKMYGMIDAFNILCSGYRACYRMKGRYYAIDLLGTIESFHLICETAGACETGVFARDATVKYLNVSCTVASACDGWWFHSQSVESHISYINVECNGYQSCYNLWMEWYAVTNSIVTIHCNGKYACAGSYGGLQIHGSTTKTYVDEFTIYCNDEYSCDGFYVHVSGWMAFGEFNIYCNAIHACDNTLSEGTPAQVNMYCNEAQSCTHILFEDVPALWQNSFNLYCNDHNASCYDIILETDQVNYANHWLNIQCPSPAVHPNNSACDDLKIQCEPFIGKLNTKWIYDDSQQQYSCQHHNDSYCCPLNGVTLNPTATTNAPTEYPTNPTLIPTSYPTFSPTYVEVNNFVDAQVNTPSTTKEGVATTISSDTKRKRNVMIIGIVCGSVFFILIMIIMIILCKSKYNAKKQKTIEMMSVKEEIKIDEDDVLDKAVAEPGANPPVITGEKAEIDSKHVVDTNENVNVEDESAEIVYATKGEPMVRDSSSNSSVEAMYVVDGKACSEVTRTHEGNADVDVTDESTNKVYTTKGTNKADLALTAGKV